MKVPKYKHEGYVHSIIIVSKSEFGKHITGYLKQEGIRDVASVSDGEALEEALVTIQAKV